jgi:hypothetical protein
VAEFRALSAVDTAAGAGDDRPSFSNSFEVAMLAFGGMRQEAQVIRTETGAEMPWPTANDTGNEGTSSARTSRRRPTSTRRSARSSGAPTSTRPRSSSGAGRAARGQRLRPGQSESAGWRRAHRPPAEPRLHRRRRRGKPKGIVTAATLGVTAASATAITADEIVNLIHSVDPAYRNDPPS